MTLVHSHTNIVVSLTLFWLSQLQWHLSRKVLAHIVLLINGVANHSFLLLHMHTVLTCRLVRDILWHHRLQLSRNLWDSAGFVAIVLGTRRLFYCCIGGPDEGQILANWFLVHALLGWLLEVSWLWFPVGLVYSWVINHSVCRILELLSTWVLHVLTVHYSMLVVDNSALDQSHSTLGNWAIPQTVSPHYFICHFNDNTFLFTWESHFLWIFWVVVWQ